MGKGVGLPGRTAITWAVGGAIGLGGVLVGLSALRLERIYNLRATS